MKIELKGFYGHSNIGDDLLMLVSYNIIKHCFNKSDIYIKTKATYVNKLLPDAITNFENLEPDLIIYGGGGVFFDFRNGDKKHMILNYFFKIIGYKNIFNLIKLIKKNKTHKNIIGIGLGIGPFTKSSKKYLSILFYLSKFEYIFVRDKISYDYVRKVNNNVELFTDLVFAKQFWKINYLKQPKKNKISFIVRDWIYHDNNLDNEIKLAERLINKGYIVDFYSFNPKNDRNCIEKLKGKYTLKLYESTKINSFIEDLSSSYAIITQRAHGAIIGNVLEIPVICIGIEAKLKNVSKMLEKSSYYQKFPIDIDKVENIIENLNAKDVENISEDFKKNNDIALKMISNMKKILNK